MGYSYQGRKLCCDLCGVAGAVKVKCPFGCCPAIAACPECRKTRKADVFSREAHIAMECDVRAAEYRAEAARETEALAAGQWVRKAAVSIPGAVKVWFRNLAGETMAVAMSADAYRAFPLGVTVTLADYEARAGVSFDRIAA